MLNFSFYIYHTFKTTTVNRRAEQALNTKIHKLEVNSKYKMSGSTRKGVQQRREGFQGLILIGGLFQR